ncbi:unnamed protein product [Closterium sp. Naga37s-1]|nr:unnamed protein product [Closterium sp. Naga37s-1]
MSTVLTSAAVVEAEGEAQAPEVAQAQVRKGRGKSGGRQRVQRRKGGDGGEVDGEVRPRPWVMVGGAWAQWEAAGVRTNKLAWLADEGVMLDSERTLERVVLVREGGAGEMTVDSPPSLSPISRTLARVNRAIARCSSVREALGVVEEMKAKGLNAANEGADNGVQEAEAGREGAGGVRSDEAGGHGAGHAHLQRTHLLLPPGPAIEDAFRLKVLLCEACGEGVCVRVLHKVQACACGARGMLTFNALISCCHQAQRFEDAFRLKATRHAHLQRAHLLLPPGATLRRCRREQQLEVQATQRDSQNYAATDTCPGRLCIALSHPHMRALLASHPPTLPSSAPPCLPADMEAQGLKPDVVTYTSLMALVVKTAPYRGRSSPSQRSVPPPADPSHWFERAMELYREMRSPERAVQPDAITFNTLMFAAAQAKLPGKVLEVYGMMVADGVPPNQITFGILLEAVGSGGRLTAALQVGVCASQEVGGSLPLGGREEGSGEHPRRKVFNEMRASGIPPTTSTFNYLIDACATAPRPDAVKAWSLFSEMEGAENVRPNAETFNLLITACTKAGDHDGALKAFGMMRERGYTRAITTSTFNKLIHSAAATPSASTETAFQVFHALPSVPCLPATLSPLRLHSRYALPSAPSFQVCVKPSTHVFLLTLPPNAHSALSHPSSHQPNPSLTLPSLPLLTLDTLITACGNDGDVTPVLSPRPSFPPPTTFIHPHPSCLPGHLSPHQLYSQMRAEGHRPDMVTLATLITAQMRAEGHRPDVVTLGTLITACGKDGDAARAMAVRQELEAEGVPPNAAVFHALMAVQGRAGLWPAALGTFREMQGRAAEWERKGSGSTVIGGPRENPLAPTLPAYTVLFDACFGPEGADATIKSLVEKGHRLSLTPALAAAVEVYREAAEAGTFSHYALTDAYRLASSALWMSRAKNQPIGEAPRGRFPKLFVSVDRTLQAVGLKGKSMRALTMQALSVDAQQLAQWLKTDAAAVFPELSK